jgi:microsomal dipeptidase-like Zn-dependent dipeptidase
MPLFDRQHPEEIEKMMTEVGMDRCLIFSDFGQPVNPTPVEGYKMFLASLLAVGIAEADLKKVASMNPARLLDLD